MENSNGSLSLEEVSEKYLSLKNRHENLCKLYDLSQQELHDIKRNQQCVVELKDHLSSEIDALQKNELKIKLEWTVKCKSLQDEMDQLRDEKWKDAENFTNTIDTLECQIKELKQSKAFHTTEQVVSQLDNTKVIEELRSYEEEIANLKDTNSELKKQLSELVNSSEMHKAEVESFKEQIECLKSNLDAKKQEVAQSTDMLHSAQEELCTANGELQHLKTQSSTFAVKGNSLFAEVDDKRQEMLKSLSQMKDKVYQLNRELVSKQAEVDSLLCEKKTLWEEYAGQSNHHDAAFTRAYERRITDLEKQTDQLNREIARWFDKNIDPNSSEAAQWLSGVMEYYRKENIRLTNEFNMASVNNLSAEQKIREFQRQIVTWRTKAIESHAAASELETKLQLAERTLQNTTNFNSTAVETELLKPPQIKTRMVKPVEEIDISLREGFREINVSAIKMLNMNESIKSKENVKPGILTSAGTENRVPKKTSFK